MQTSAQDPTATFSGANRDFLSLEGYLTFVVFEERRTVTSRMEPVERGRRDISFLSVSKCEILEFRSKKC